jgi:hypothetical protein
MASTTPCLPCSSVAVPTNVPGTPGVNAYAVVTSPFTVPSPNGNVTIQVNQASGFVEGQNVFVGMATGTGANFSVYSINSPTSLTLTYLSFAGDLAAGTAVPTGYLVVAGVGNVAALSTVGFTSTTQSFTLGSPFTGSVTINVGSAAPFQPGQNIFIGNGTSQINARVLSVSVSNKTLTIIPLGFPGDLLSGAIGSGALVATGAGDDFSFGTATVLAQTFTIPGAGTSGTAYVSNLNTIGAGGPQFVVIYSQVGQSALIATFAVTPSTSTAAQLTLTPLLLPSDTQSGVFPVGSLVIPIGGPAPGFAPGIAADVTGVQMAKFLSAAPGSGYAITASAAPIAIGSTLQIVLPLAGTYLIFGWVNINAVGASFPVSGSGVSNITFVYGITGATSSFANALVVRPRVGASTGQVTQSGTESVNMMPPATAVVPNAGATVVILAVIDVEPSTGVGSVEVMAAELFAVKIA